MEDFTQSDNKETWAALYGSTAVLGFVGNVAYIYFWKRYTDWREPRHFLLLNQAVANILVCVLRIPFEIHSLLLGNAWIFKSFLCNIYQTQQFFYLSMTGYNLAFLIANLTSGCSEKPPASANQTVQLATLGAGSGSNDIEEHEPPGATWQDPKPMGACRKYHLYLVFVWLIAIVFVVPIWTNGFANVYAKYGAPIWFQDGFLYQSVSCNFKRPEEFSYLLASFVANFCVPVSLMLFCICSWVQVKVAWSMLLLFLITQTLLALCYLNVFMNFIDWNNEMFSRYDVDVRLAGLMSYLFTVFQPALLFFCVTV